MLSHLISLAKTSSVNNKHAAAIITGKRMLFSGTNYHLHRDIKMEDYLSKMGITSRSVNIMPNSKKIGKSITVCSCCKIPSNDRIVNCICTSQNLAGKKDCLLSGSISEEHVSRNTALLYQQQRERNKAVKENKYEKY